jgi:hypothetical protein
VDDFIRKKGNTWLRDMLKLAKYDFSGDANASVVQEGVIDLLTILTDADKRAIFEHWTEWSPVEMEKIFHQSPATMFENIKWGLTGTWGHDDKYMDLYEMLRKAWFAGVTAEQRNDALDKLREFLGKERNVRTSGITTVVFPEASDPRFWEKPVLGVITIEDAVRLADADPVTGPHWDEGGDDVYIDSYWETHHGQTSYDASDPYRDKDGAGLLWVYKKEESRLAESHANPNDMRNLVKSYKEYEMGRPYSFLKWVRKEHPEMANHRNTPGAWNEEEARKRFLFLLKNHKPRKAE